MYIVADAILARLLAIADPIKDSIPEAIGQLHNKDLIIVMLTGDNKTTAEAVAVRLGIDSVMGPRYYLEVSLQGRKGKIPLCIYKRYYSNDIN